MRHTKFFAVVTPRALAAVAAAARMPARRSNRNRHRQRIAPRRLYASVRSSARQRADTADDRDFVRDDGFEALHVKSGPAAIYYNTKDMGSGQQSPDQRHVQADQDHGA